MLSFRLSRMPFSFFAPAFWAPCSVLLLPCKASSRRDPTPPGRAVLFRAAADLETDGDETRGWDAWVEGGLTVIRTPGTHRTMIDPPQVEVIAERLRTPLRQPLVRQAT